MQNTLDSEINLTQITQLWPADCLHPEGYFKPQETLYVSINAWAKSRGYAFTTQYERKMVS